MVDPPGSVRNPGRGSRVGVVLTRTDFGVDLLVLQQRRTQVRHELIPAGRHLRVDREVMGQNSIVVISECADAGVAARAPWKSC